MLANVTALGAHHTWHLAMWFMTHYIYLITIKDYSDLMNYEDKCLYDTEDIYQ